MKLLAPNGKPSNLTPEQYRLVRTPAFKNWFGDWENDPENASKVVDENGEPLICYHGTYKKFNVFEITREGGWFFTEFKRIAQIYAETVQMGVGSKKNETPIVIPAFLNIRNLNVKNFYQKVVQRLSPTIKSSKNKGYDGLLIKNGLDVGGYYDQYVVFSSNQIKLADGTNTTFDANNPDIRYRKGGSVRLSKTPAPKKDRIYGSKINKPFSASSSEKAKSIKLDDKVIKSIKNILKEHNSKEGSIKIPLSIAKAVVRRGMGAYSVSYRPTISGGKPNARVAWGLARLKAFVYKVEKGKSKSGKYNQDDDLISEISNKFKDGGSVNYKYFLVLKKKKPVFKVKFSKYNKDTEKDMSAMLDKLHDMGYKLNVISEKEYNEFDNNKVNKEDVAEFTRNWTFYKEGGVITDEQEETYNKWKKLVNMSASELKKFLDSEEGKIAGLSAKEANELGIDYGRESAKWILKMKAIPYKQWTPNMWRWAKKQISFISRMTGNKGKLYDEKGKRTRKHLSLLVWGNNPLKNKK